MLFHPIEFISLFPGLAADSPVYVGLLDNLNENIRRSNAELSDILANLAVNGFFLLVCAALFNSLILSLVQLSRTLIFTNGIATPLIEEYIS